MELEDTIGSMFWARVRRYGNRTALRVKRGGRWVDISWEEWGRQVSELARGLLVLGLQEGERVALLSENRPEWTYVDLAVLSIRAVDVPVYATNIPEQVEHILKDSGARFIVVSTEEQLEKVRAVRAGVPTLQKAILMDAGERPSEDWVLSLAEVQRVGREQMDHQGVSERVGRVQPHDLATLIYTSGTTGAPKGVMLTHGNFVANIRGITEVIPLGESDIALSFLPLSHAFERLAGYYTMLAVGGTIAFAESLEKVPDNIQEIRPTVMCSVPRLYEKMHARVLASVGEGSLVQRKIFSWAMGVGEEVSRRVRAKREVPLLLRARYRIAERLVFEKLRARMGDRLRFFISGGAPLAREIAEFFHAAGILILEGYGLTETTPVISANRPDAYKLGSVGQPLPNLEVRIAPDGEILVRGPSVMKGYYNRPEETREVLSEEGWFATGDIGYLDQDGFLYITDRKKDIIVTAGGKNIAPQNIENLIKLNRYIEQVCVIGDKKAYLTALIVPSFPDLEEFARQHGIPFRTREDLLKDPRVEALFKEAVEEANAQLARYETIKRFTVLPVEFSQESGELTPTLKVKRKVVEIKFKEHIDRMYAE